LALDEPKSSDQRIDHQGVTFVIDQELHIWLRLGREVHVGYHQEGERFSVRLSGPTCC
jgi:hypothetical protein